LNQESCRKLISGQRTDVASVILRFFLTIASQIYIIIISLRNFLYSKGWLKAHTVSVPVISIGNITTGGTGKTPLVIWLCKFLQNNDISCAILTRGYKTHTQTRATSDGRQATTDEPAIFTKSCPKAKIIINPDRVAGAAKAVNDFDAKVLIMDDGFQHRRLHRDLDIVAIDAMCPFGYGKILPAGLLREPVTSLKRADAVVITKCNQIHEAQSARLEEKLLRINPDMIIAKSIHKPTCAKSISGEKINLEKLKDKRIFAFCGIGNPDAFFSTIKGLGANLIDSRVYNDHHQYTDNCLADIYEQAQRLNADLILTTQKDWTKIASLVSIKNDIPFAYLAIELKFTDREDKLKRLIEDALEGKITQK
jgi:tetraacyldisaccharide 4'-kinase